MAMEQGEKGSDEKAEKLIKLYGHRFFSMQYTVHPSGIPGEARGKSSNVAWAARFYADNWLIKEEAGQELITVMDADTQLTEKYFQCLAYKYCTTPTTEHDRCLFAPVLIFDRNANHVPFVVRLADFCWSIGLMANFQLPIKFPCSVYTVSMLLAQQVGFWDAGPESIGEDIHMALKCWTHLRMNLKMTPIYIPASCSNVQGPTYLSSIAARFEQSKRHLWGSLDFGYLAARLITKRCWTASPFRSILSLYILFEIFFQPYFGFYHLTGQFIWPGSLTTYGALVLQYTTYIRLALIPFALIVAFAYERYHAICCDYRRNVLQQVTARQQTVDVMSSEGALAGVPMAEEVDGLVVEQVASGNEIAFRKWYQILDWAGLPFCLVAYYMIPGVNAMLGQLFTKKLDYKVSLKPTAAKPVAVAADAPTSGENSASAGQEEETVEGEANTNDDMIAVVIDEGKTVTAASSSDSLAGKARKTGFMKRFIQDGIVRGHAPTDSGVELESIRQPQQEQAAPTSTAH